MLNPLINILTPTQAPQGGITPQGGGLQSAGLGGDSNVSGGSGGSFVNLLGNVVAVVESAQGLTDNSALATTALLNSGISNEKLTEDTISALYGAGLGTPVVDYAPVAAPVATGDALQVDVNTDAQTTTPTDALAQAALNSTINSDEIAATLVDADTLQQSTSDELLLASQAKTTALNDAANQTTQQNQTQLQAHVNALQTLSTKELPSSISAFVKSADNDENAKSLLEKAFKLLGDTNSSAPQNVDKSTVVRATQAYGDQKNDQSSYTPFKNDGAFGAVLANQAQAQDANTVSNTQIAATTAVGKVGEASSEAAVAVKNPVPNFPSHNPTAAEQVSLRISHALKAGESELSIKLEPAELGKVEVRLNLPPHNSENKAIVSVIADDARTLDMLKTDSRSLEKALNDAGIKTDSSSLSFNLRGDNNSFMARQDNSGFGNNSPKAKVDDLAFVNASSLNSGASYVSDKALDIMV